MERKRKACVSGMPSAPVCRNSICALTFPYTLHKAISPIVPRGIGPLESTAEPPVSERRCRTPTNRVSSIVNRARSLLGTRMRGGRGLLRVFGNFFKICQHCKRQGRGQDYAGAYVRVCVTAGLCPAKRCGAPSPHRVRLCPGSVDSFILEGFPRTTGWS
jgi:hypothetical protein